MDQSTTKSSVVKMMCQSLKNNSAQKMEKLLGLILLTFLISSFVFGSNEHEVVEERRKGKILNLFSVVRFPNSVCAGDALNGTCYSAEECTARGGVQSGTCAGGYGVCCTCKYSNNALKCFKLMLLRFIFYLLVQKMCGESSSENCTYFQSSGTEVGQCRLKICPCNDNICQLRLDFQTFVINQPKAGMINQ